MKHTESAGGVVVNSKGQILIVSQRGKSWSLPKGHIETDETPMNAAKREIYEESGIHELELIKELGNYQRHKLSLEGGDDSSEMKTIHMFLFRTNEEKLEPKDPDNPKAMWVDRKNVSDLL